MTPDLKPCPFCNGDGEIVRDELHMMRGYIVKCSGCGAETMYYKTKKQAVDVWVKCEKCGVTTDFFRTVKQALIAWNNRPIERKLLNRISSLELDLAHLPEDFYRRTIESLQKENKRYFDAFAKVKEFLKESRLEDYPWFYNVDNKDIQYVFDIVDKTLRGENVKKM